VGGETVSELRNDGGGSLGFCEMIGDDGGSTGLP
jgi:hypothetical protein